MCVWLVWRPDTKFFSTLLGADRDLTRKLQQRGCPHCGGRLDRADYPRKPRGDLDQAAESMGIRFSLCCAREGCRRRLTPPSLRFLGRKVYYGAWLLVVSAAWLCGLVLGRQIRGVPRRTVGRWQQWWHGGFLTTELWRVQRARLMPPVDELRLPLSLLERFTDTPVEMIRGTLEFVRPLTTISATRAMAW
jgi:hypothetical protein